jgi:hypothetical protein
LGDYSGPNSVRFAAVIGHADDPDLLRTCIVHHLGIGIERIFVALNDSDPGSPKVVDCFAGDDRVRGAYVGTFAADPFEFFSAAIAPIREWCAPEWLIFLDTDEFWLPLREQIGGVRSLEQHDLLQVSRFNAPALLNAGHDGVSVVLPPTKATLVFGDPQGSYSDLREEGASWGQTRVAPKIMVRPELVARIARGAHGALALDRPFRILEPDDLLIVHVPFTSRERFRRKLAAIRTRLRSYGSRFAPGEATHWKDWMLLETEPAIEEEFKRQAVDAQDIDRLVSTGALVTARQIFDRWSALAERRSCDEEPL